MTNDNGHNEKIAHVWMKSRFGMNEYWKYPFSHDVYVDKIYNGLPNCIGLNVALVYSVDDAINILKERANCINGEWFFAT